MAAEEGRDGSQGRDEAGGSDRRAEVNRTNALHSTGPKTPEGKAASSRNALRHGLLSRENLLRWEDPAAFEEFRAVLLEALAPVGALEDLLSERIIGCAWRLRRLGHAEAGFLTLHRSAARASKARADAERCGRRVGGMDNPAEMDELLHGRFEVHDKVAHAAALQREREALALGEGEGPALALAFAEREATLANLSRYEAGIERAFHRNLHELQRLQAARAGQAVPLPVAVDVDVGIAGGAVPASAHTG